MRRHGRVKILTLVYDLRRASCTSNINNGIVFIERNPSDGATSANKSSREKKAIDIIRQFAVAQTQFDVISKNGKVLASAIHEP